jgi:hypothetical protein
MTAARFSRWIIDQGATWTKTLEWKPNGSLADLTGYTARMSLKAGGVVAVSLTTENNRITLGGAAGTITLLIDAVTTAGLAGGSYAYDLELVVGATVTRLIQGYITVSENVTT